MTVTISPKNNLEFCRVNGLVEIVKEACLCVDFPDENCYYCKGTKENVEEIFPFEMNISSGNFSTLWNSLGLEFDYCGQIDPREVIDSLNSFDENLLIRANFVDGNIYSFGIDIERAKSYIDRLRNIAEESLKRNQLISWG